MAKTKAKAAPAATQGDAPKKRSKLKLILFALVPLVALGGVGYGAWAYFLAPAPQPHAEAEGHGGVDPQKVAALKAEAAAETSATYSFALAQLLRSRCGGAGVAALKQASDAEAAHDGMLVSMSWQAALRRAGSVTEVSCDRILAEIGHAEARAGGAAASAGHGGKPKGH